MLPLVDRHLRAHAAAGVPAEVLGELAARSRQQVLRNMRTAQVDLQLMRKVGSRRRTLMSRMPPMACGIASMPALDARWDRWPHSRSRGRMTRWTSPVTLPSSTAASSAPIGSAAITTAPGATISTTSAMSITTGRMTAP